MYAHNSKAAIENGALAPSDLTTWSRVQIPFAGVTSAKTQVTNARSSQWIVAVGAVSVAAIAVTVLNIGFSGSDSGKLAVSSGSQATAADVRPSIDFGPGPSEESLYSAGSEIERTGGSSSKKQALRLQGVAENAPKRSAPVKEMPSLETARAEARGNSSPAASAAKDRNAISSAPEQPILTNLEGAAPEPKAANKAAERLALQSRGLGAGEAATRISFAPVQQAQPGNAKTADAMPALRLPQVEVDAKRSNLYSVTTAVLPAAGELNADDLVALSLVTADRPVGDVRLLDVELADALIVPITPPTGTGALDESEFIPPTLNGPAISPFANTGNTSPFKAPQRVRADEENALQLVSRQAIGASYEAASSTGAVAPAERVPALIQKRSEVGVAAAFPRQSAGGSSIEMLPGTVAAQALSGGDAVGSLPLRISTEALVSVRLADLISLFEDRMDRPLFVWLKSSSNANEYVTFDTLRSAGIDAEYDVGTQQVALSIADDRTP